MNGNDIIPFFFAHTDERFVAEDTSIGDQDMDSSECLHCCLYYRFTILGGAHSGNRLSTHYHSRSGQRFEVMTRGD